MSFDVASVQGVPQKRSNFKDTSLALASGLVVPSILQTGGAVVACEGMSRLSSNLSKDQIEIVNKGVKEVADNLTNLTQKGLKIVDARKLDPFGFNSFRASGNSVGAKIKNYFYDFLNPISSLQNGKNACFATTNKVYYHPEKMSLAAFHELGHAHNYNNSKFWRVLQQNFRKPAMILPFAIATFVAFSRNSKPENGKELTTGQKVKNFVRNNAAGLTFASTLPMVAEEIMASVKGCKWANKVLDKNLARKVLKTNILGATSYLAVGILTALGVHFAKKIKDN